ncbi:MAG: acyl-CoA dehydrogenase family protein [Pseudomonadota bacterium]
MQKFEKLLNRNDLSPYLSAEQFEFRESVHRLLQKHASAEYLSKCDEGKIFPQKLVDLAAEQGWFAITLPEQYGGVGGYMDMIGMLEIISYHSSSLARFWNVSVNMVGGALVLLATDALKQKLLPALAEGKLFFAFALSENGSGSDAAALRTNARLDGDQFVVNGTKMWITGVLQAGYVLTAVRTDKDEGKHEGISLLLIPRETPGVDVRPIDLLGGHMMRSCEVNLVDARVPRELLVGELHRGWMQLLAVLSKERIAMGAICTGAAQAALDQALEYAKERKQFGRAIASFQAISHKFAEMQTLIDASRLLTFRAARLLAEGKPCHQESAQAKFFATDSYMRIATEGVQIMGANGYSMEYPMQRHFREAKMFQILGGTSEVQRNNVAREMLK